MKEAFWFRDIFSFFFTLLHVRSVRSLDKAKAMAAELAGGQNPTWSKCKPVFQPIQGKQGIP